MIHRIKARSLKDSREYDAIQPADVSNSHHEPSDRDPRNFKNDLEEYQGSRGTLAPMTASQDPLGPNILSESANSKR
ncbi:hypothetical protein DSO57_1030760 [Entomophthora muscae]|uniref:Uncharacterized protein n=2 Tax=Entomophthora muscae TaxID=34485 RepID=A0ACC2U0A4_9FUNG|nr:hypothetical protein DSO57_1031283 [Entomophthora muscae]KAJ9079892.1 hypothetical protein DSO57_1030760 [Entomophthora muscae]